MARHRPLLLFRILLVVLSLALVVLTDWIFGLFYDQLPRSHVGRVIVEYHLGRLTEKGRSHSPHPYMLYVNTPQWTDAGVTQVNSSGFRGREITAQPADGVTRILAVGGSTTYGTGVKLPEEAWPAQLEALLAQTTPRGVEVVNGGMPYATSAELLAHYMYRNRYLGAEIVIVHTGGNDSVPLVLDDYDPEYRHFRPGWSATSTGMRPGERFLWQYSGAARLLYATWMRDSDPPIQFLETNPPWKLEAEAALTNVQDRYPLGFERNLDLLVRNVIADGAQPVLFKHLRANEEQFKTIVRRSKLARTNEHVYEALQIARRKNLDVMGRLAEKYGVPVVGIAAAEIPEEHFVDYAHLTVEGHAIKARAVAGVVGPLLE